MLPSSIEVWFSRLQAAHLAQAREFWKNWLDHFPKTKNELIYQGEPMIPDVSSKETRPSQHPTVLEVYSRFSQSFDFFFFTKLMKLVFHQYFDAIFFFPTLDLPDDYGILH